VLKSVVTSVSPPQRNGEDQRLSHARDNAEEQQQQQQNDDSVLQPESPQVALDPLQELISRAEKLRDAMTVRSSAAGSRPPLQAISIPATLLSFVSTTPFLLPLSTFAWLTG
jgi:hypothetical protein